MKKKQQKHKEKQEQFINHQSVAQENLPIDINHSHQFKINLFISNQQIDTHQVNDNIIQSQRAQLTTPCVSTTPQSQLQGNKRKYSQKSDNYHRVGHSRKIKTRKVIKQHLQRSQYFYYDSLDQLNDSSPISQLLNQYEAYQQLAALAYEKKVIKLSHYGRKSSQYSNSNSEKKRFTDREERIKNSQIVEFSLHNQGNNVRALSKSLIGWDIKSRALAESEVRLEQKQQRESMGKQQIKINELDRRLNIKLGQEHHQLTKYTTPIRTIYLNHPQQQPHILNQSPHNPNHGKPPKNHTLQSSPNQHQKLSTFTPLISQRVHKNQLHKPFKSIMAEPLKKSIKEEQHSVHLETRSSCQINKSCEHSNSNKLLNQNSKLGLSVVGSRKRFQIAKVEKGETVQLLQGQVIENLPKQQILITHQISLPKQYQLHRNRYLMNQHHQHQNNNKLKNSSTTHLNHSHSHSRSRKGLSLTQSATNIGSLNRPKVNSVASIAEIKQTRDEKQNDPLARKLNASYVCHPKRVEIRIY